MKILTLQSLLTLILVNTDKEYVLIEPSITCPPIIGFVGSRSFNDFTKNINIVPRQWPPQKPSGLVHGGFVSKLESLTLKNTEIEDFSNTYDDILITGHSLGGAISTLFASSLKENNKRIHSVHTFGAPPLALKKFKLFYKKQGLYSSTFRYTTPRDPVTNLVPVYEHLGNKILLPFEGSSRLVHHDMGTYKNLISDMEVGNWIIHP